jgi:hypothetical protein
LGGGSNSFSGGNGHGRRIHSRRFDVFGLLLLSDI